MRSNPNANLAMPHRIAYMVLALICIVLGFAGLILPIIPGFLFFIGAAYCLSKVSRRFKLWADNQTFLKNFHERTRRFNTVDIVSRVKLGMLMGLNMLVASLATGLNLLKRCTRVFSTN